MVQNHKKIRYSLPLIAILSIGLWMMVIIPVNALESVSIGLKRNVGTDMGDKIEGDWTLFATGTEGVTKLELYFNNTLEVTNDTGNKLKFNFNTNDYDVGIMNITLKGYVGATGEWVQTTVSKEFIGGEIGVIIIIIVAAIAIPSVIISVVVKKKKEKTGLKKPTTEEMKKEIKIDLDKKMF